MLDIISSLVGTVGFLIKYLIESIKSIVAFISLIPTFVEYLNTSISFLPSMLFPLGLAYVSLWAVLFVLRKN